MSISSMQGNIIYRKFSVKEILVRYLQDNRQRLMDERNVLFSSIVNQNIISLQTTNMITARVHFDSDEKLISFLLLPKLGETIAYTNAQQTQHFKIFDIVHTVDASNNEASQNLDIYASAVAIGRQ